jgi:hypothetical protein
MSVAAWYDLRDWSGCWDDLLSHGSYSFYHWLLDLDDSLDLRLLHSNHLRRLRNNSFLVLVLLLDGGVDRGDAWDRVGLVLNRRGDWGRGFRGDRLRSWFGSRSSCWGCSRGYSWSWLSRSRSRGSWLRSNSWGCCSRSSSWSSRLGSWLSRLSCRGSL